MQNGRIFISICLTGVVRQKSFTMAEQRGEDEDHYAVLGISSGQSDTLPIARVMGLARVSMEEIKEHYGQALRTSANNPFTLTKVKAAFQVLSSQEKRQVYDMKLMENAAAATWEHILTASKVTVSQLQDTRGSNCSLIWILKHSDAL